jgi:hypothetical protein
MFKELRPKRSDSWQPGESLLDSPVMALPARIVGEDEYRDWGTIPSTAAAGDNLIFAGRREKVDLEILEVVLQNQSASTITAQLHVSGYMIGAAWLVGAGTFWSEAGFILMNGQQLFLRTSTTGQWSFEVRWRLYYGRKK